MRGEDCLNFHRPVLPRPPPDCMTQRPDGISRGPDAGFDSFRVLHESVFLWGEDAPH